MTNFAEEQTVVTAELWRAWEAKSREQGRATARRFRLASAGVIGLIALVAAVYFSFAR